MGRQGRNRNRFCLSGDPAAGLQGCLVCPVTVGEGYQEDLCKQNAFEALVAYTGSPLEKISRSAVNREKSIWAGRISGKKEGDEVNKKNSPTNHSSMR